MGTAPDVATDLASATTVTAPVTAEDLDRRRTMATTTTIQPKIFEPHEVADDFVV